MVEFSDPIALMHSSTACRLSKERTARCAGIMAELGVAWGPSVPFAGDTNDAGTFTFNKAE
jgi:hypothetical protein